MLALCLPCYAEGQSLVEALLRMRTSYPAAEITGRFADYRGLSMYRSHAGLHNGYDIGMPAGAAVPAVWAGTVVAITPWTSTQVGVSVQTGPFEVTYGHLIPGSVRVGDFVRPGDVLGTVAVDHVDIKMRDGSGAYVDFGEGVGATPVDPADLAEERARLALEDLQALKTRLASLNFELASLQREARLLRAERGRLGRMVPQLDKLVAEGAMPAVDEGRLPLRLHFVDTRLKEVEARSPQVKKQRETLQAQLWLAQTQFDELALEAARYGREVKPSAPAPTVARSLPANLPAGGDRLEQLLKYGVLSKKEYDEARRRQRWDAAAGKQPVGGAPSGGSQP